MHRRYVQADTLLFICYCWRSKFITKIWIWKHKYFKYTLFCYPRFYFSCTVGTRYERWPYFSCPELQTWKYKKLTLLPTSGTLSNEISSWAKHHGFVFLICVVNQASKKAWAQKVLWQYSFSKTFSGKKGVVLCWTSFDTVW